MKKLFLIITLVISINYCYSQDSIVLATNEIIISKVIEVSTLEIKYKRLDNLNGPIYSVLKSEVLKIRYENGTFDVFNKNIVTLDEQLLRTSITNPNVLTKKGNKVFIEIPDAASRAGERYFIDALNEWGYWKIVTNKNEAHFIIVFNIDKKAMLDKSACVTFKTRDEKEFKKSESYISSTTAFNGYNAFRAVANKVVEKYLKKEFR